MTEKFIRKLRTSFGLIIPAKIRKKLYWGVGTTLTAWIEDDKIFFRKSKNNDKQNLKLFLYTMHPAFEWVFPTCWRRYYNFKIGDKFEFIFSNSSSSTIFARPLKPISRKPYYVLEKLYNGRLRIPKDMLRIAQIEPLGGFKMTPEQDKILITPEKIESAKYFVGDRGALQIPFNMRQEMNIPPYTKVQLTINNDAIVLKKYCDQGKFIVLSKNTREYIDKKAITDFKKHKTNHKKIKKEARH